MIEKKIEALEDCKRLWMFLAMNPEMTKREAFQKIWPDRLPILHDCPACEYTKQFSWRKSQNCAYCLIDEWRSENGSEATNCENPGSPFYDWCLDREKVKAAIRIVHLVDESIQRRLAKDD